MTLHTNLFSSADVECGLFCVVSGSDPLSEVCFVLFQGRTRCVRSVLCCFRVGPAECGLCCVVSGWDPLSAVCVVLFQSRTR